MFSQPLTYYHGTSIKNWKLIQKEKLLKPNFSKSVGSYWITKGAYFVCENPYIALWYAHMIAFNQKSTPIVLAMTYSAKSQPDSQIINLLTSDGQKLLSKAHSLLKQKLKNIVNPYEGNENLDSTALQSLLNNTESSKAIIASFQEGKSYQSIHHGHDYTNKYVTNQTGISPGDHVEICFVPELNIENVEISLLSKEDILKDNTPCCLWDVVSESLTEPVQFQNEDYKKRFLECLKKKYE